MQTNQMRTLRLNSYRVLRDYGKAITIYRVRTSDTDTRTGLTTRDIQNWPVLRALNLPDKSFTKFLYDQAHANLGTVFSMGGYVDGGKAIFGIDTRDLPKDFVFMPDDYIVQNGKRFVFSSIELWREVGMLAVTCVRTDGDMFVEIHNIYHNDIVGTFEPKNEGTV